MSTEIEVSTIQKNWFFFFQQSWNIFSDSFLTIESRTVCFLLFRALCLATVSQCINLFAITWASSVLCPPHALVSAQMGLTVHQCLVFTDQWVHSWVFGKQSCCLYSVGQGVATLWAVPGPGLDMPDTESASLLIFINRLDKFLSDLIYFLRAEAWLIQPSEVLSK